MINFTIPGDPVGKGRARSTRSGIHYTPEKTRNYEAFVKMLAVEAMQGKALLKGECFAKIIVDYAVPKSTSKKMQQQFLTNAIRPTRKPDIDNIVKSVFDACIGVVFKDDSQVVHMQVGKFYSDIPKIYVEIWERKDGG